MASEKTRAVTQAPWMSGTAASSSTSTPGRRSATTLPIDVHLMITDPDDWVERFVHAVHPMQLSMMK